MFTEEELSSEEWRPVVGWDDLYEVSSLGCVRSKERIVEYIDGRKRFLESKTVKTKESKSGLLMVRLYRNRVGKFLYVHRIVAEAFIDNTHGLAEVMHKDGNLKDNRRTNLVWSNHTDLAYWGGCESSHARTDGVDREREWRPVVGFEGYYEVSDNGLVRSVRRTVKGRGGIDVTLPGKMMSTSKDNNGYPKVVLTKHGDEAAYMVHRLMADAFIPNPDGLKVVTHVNGVRDDNRLDNLAWTTYSETHSTYVPQAELESKISAEIDEWKSRHPEEWSCVCGYEGVYEISSWGNVKSLARIVTRSDGRTCRVPERLLKPIVDPNGYHTVSLYKDGHRTRARVHRLVAEAFISNVYAKPFIDHINGLRDDNRVVNLRWCTREENNDNVVNDGSRPKTKPATDVVAKDMLPGEEWRRVEGYDGLYEVSNMGRVWKRPNETIAKNGDVYRNAGRFLNIKPGRNGYVSVRLHDFGTSTSAPVHRLVADAFLPNPTGARRVRHISNDNSDNRVENLEWVVTDYMHAVEHLWRDDGVLDGEEWRDIDGYDGLYQISSFGRVRSIRRPHARGGIMHPVMSGSGYPSIRLSKDGMVRNHVVHRLVANAFVQNPNNFDVVNHKDEDKTNPRADNLEWVSFTENVNYGTALERSRLSRMKKPNKKPVLQLDADGSIVRRWESMSEVHRTLGIGRSALRDACNKVGYGSIKNGIIRGFQWCFEEDCQCAS